MNSRCLYCYQELEDGQKDFHPKRHIAVPGVQPKISMTMVKETLGDGDRGRLTVMIMLDGNYILKPLHEGYPELPQNEHLTMKIAAEFGLPVVPSSSYGYLWIVFWILLTWIPELATLDLVFPACYDAKT